MKRVSFGLTIAVYGVSTVPAWGQAIAPDTTLGTSNSTTQETTIRSLPSTLIQGGVTQGGNLFHSFLRFNIPEGRGAYFVNPTGIRNIFSRVTGGERTEIFGKLGVLGDANLFLMNPNGILFGQTGSLDVGGSFVATTANAIQFGDRGSFDATNPTAPNSVLTVDPSAFLFTQIPTGKIINRSIAPAGTTPAGFSASGLRVPDGENLLLIGGDIEVEGGRLNAFGGRIELAGLAEPGKVLLNQQETDFTLKALDNAARSDVTFWNGAIAQVSTTTNGGNLAITGRNIFVLGDSLILAGIMRGQNSANRQAGNIAINSTNAVNVRTGSRISNTVSELQEGNSGNITINANSIFLSDNARLTTSTLGKGNAGEIIIQTKGSISLNNQALISSRVESDAIGQAGNIIIDSRTLDLNNKSQLSSATFGQGNAGDIVINTRNFVIIRNGTPENQTGAFSTVERNAIGKGGDIRITTGTLAMVNGGLLTAATNGVGNAGNVTINAQDRVVLQGGFFLESGEFIATAINNDVGRQAIGKAGNINISSNTLEVLDRAELSSSTFGSGAAGNISLNIRDLIVLNRGFALSQVTRGAIGKGGDIRILTNNLQLLNSAKISSATAGKGDAGNIDIEARDSISIQNSRALGSLRENNLRVLDNGIFSTVEQNAVGEGGDIRIRTGLLEMRNGALIKASTAGVGNAGNVIIDIQDRIVSTSRIRVIRQSDGTLFSLRVGNVIASDVNEAGIGSAGDIDISTGSLELFDGTNLLSVSAGDGDAGDIIINVRETAIFDFSFAKSGTFGVNALGQGGDIRISTPSLELRNGAQFDASNFGQGDAGNIEIDATRSVLVARAANELNGGYASAIFSTNGA